MYFTGGKHIDHKDDPQPTRVLCISTCYVYLDGKTDILFPIGTETMRLCRLDVKCGHCPQNDTAL